MHTLHFINQYPLFRGPRDAEKVRRVELRLCSAHTQQEQGRDARGPYLQEGEGQGVLAATQQRFTLSQRLVVQCNAIDLGPDREPVRPAARTGLCTLPARVGQWA